MGRLKKDHILGAGGSAVAAGAVGATIGGLAAGPPGVALGAVAGTALGAVIGDRTAEALDPRGDLGHFEQIYKAMPYYVRGMTWDDYAPAYRMGILTHGHGDAALLEQEWARSRGRSRLLWSEVRPVIEHAWEELDNSG